MCRAKLCQSVASRPGIFFLAEILSIPTELELKAMIRHLLAPSSRHMLRKKGSSSLGHLRQVNRFQVFLQILHAQYRKLKPQRRFSQNPPRSPCQASSEQVGRLLWAKGWRVAGNLGPDEEKHGNGHAEASAIANTFCKTLLFSEM